MSRCPSLSSSYLEISRFVRTKSLSKVHHLYTNHRGPSPRNHLGCRSFSCEASKRQTDVSSRREALQKFKHNLKFPGATYDIKHLKNISDEIPPDEVWFHGYVGSRHDLSKKLSFAQIQSIDLKYNLQVISSASSKDGASNPAHLALKSLNEHSPVAVRGFLKERKPPYSSTLAGLEIIPLVELELTDIAPLNEFPKGILAQEDTNFPPEQRHLQMRMSKDIRDALQFRSKVVHHCRNWFHTREFVEVETPLLFKSTPEGAREFLVPTRKKGLAYALPQSPQQYKQILMASGTSKYFQIAKCFRDEDLRADRQPEFTQLDLEMAFSTGADIMNIIEEFIRSLASPTLWKDLEHESLDGPFPRLTYTEAMSRYGSDKPDLRRGMEIRPIGHLLPVDLVSKISNLNNPIVEVMKLHVSDSPSDTHSFVTRFMDSPEAAPFIVNPAGQPGIFIYDPRKPLQGLSAFGFEATERIEEELALEEGDLVVLQARENAPFAGGSTPLGNLRLALHKAAVAEGVVDPPQGVKLVWITDFPLFSPINDTDPGQGGAAGISSTHHPFTAPKTAEDVDHLLTNPLDAWADHYDIVVNGVELGGGSRRIHDANVQEFVLRDVLKMNDASVEHFQHLLDVLSAGCPPHAGIALGLDRLIAVMLSKESVRDVIAFPKSGRGEDLLVKSPSLLTDGQLETYHLKLSDG